LKARARIENRRPPSKKHDAGTSEREGHFGYLKPLAETEPRQGGWGLRRHLELKLQSPPSSNGDKMRDRSIDLAIPLLLMKRVGHLTNNFSSDKTLVWD
jgi:hypothetical protein